MVVPLFFNTSYKLSFNLNLMHNLHQVFLMFRKFRMPSLAYMYRKDDTPGEGQTWLVFILLLLFFLKGWFFFFLLCPHSR